MLLINGKTLIVGSIMSNWILKNVVIEISAKMVLATTCCGPSVRNVQDWVQSTTLLTVGASVTIVVGAAVVGFAVIATVGKNVGAAVGATTGAFVSSTGALVGLAIGLLVGTTSTVGARVGALLGGAVVGGAIGVLGPVITMLRMVPQALGRFSFCAGWLKSRLGLDKYK